MADSVQIFPQIMTTTKSLLMDYCKTHKAKQGEVVDAALIAFLTPGAGDNQDMLFHKINAIEQAMTAILGLLEKQVEFLETLQKPSEPKVATREEQYPELFPARATLPDPEDEEPAPPAGGFSWRRLFKGRQPV